jgi:lipopolysaccharide assembly protein A
MTLAVSLLPFRRARLNLTLHCIFSHLRREATDMRWIHLTVMVLFVAATALFAVQNFEIVTMSFLGFSARAPMALLVAIVYLLGMVTGGSLLALLRRSFQGSRRTAIG